MRTDTIFYQLFQLMPNLLSELLGQVGNDYQFKSVEIKELSRRIDGVFLPTNSDSQQPIYFAEVQSPRDERLY
jgi:predicted transposase YdaD